MTTFCIVPRCNRGDARPAEIPADRYACTKCVTALRHTLRGIEVYAHLLTIMTLPMQGRGERRSPGFGSRSPARDDVIVALDYRSRTGGDGPDDEVQPTRSILGSLHQLASWVRGEQDVTAPREITVTTEIGYLLGGVEYAARQGWVDEFATDLRELHAQCRRLAGDQPARPIGRCPTLLDDGGECGTPLYMPTTGDSVTCRGCDREWRRPEWERLAALINDTRRAG
jgi:hypothetical protein